MAPSCKIGEGFPCPRCSAVCSYDAKECELCQLQCYYEAGIGVVVLKERQVSVEHDKNLVRDAHEKVAMRVDAEEMGSKKSRISPKVNFQDSSHLTHDDDDPIPAQPAEGLPDGWTLRKIPRVDGSRSDTVWYSPKKWFKFRSKQKVQDFLMRLEETNGDESVAMQLYKNKCRKRTVCHGEDNHVDTAAAKALVELANQKNGTLTEDSRHLMRSSIQSSPPKENAQTKDDDSPSINRGITPVLVQLYSNELHPDVRECFEISGRSSSAHAVGMNVEASDRQDKSEAATYTCVANQVVTLQGTHVEIKNLLREREAALRAAETTIASMRLKASTAISNRQQLVDAVFRLANAVNGSVENNEMSNREIETLLSTFSAERDQLAKVVEVKTAELSAMRQELSYSLSRLVELQSEFEKQSVLNNDAEKRVNELLSENNRANENMVAMQAKNDDVIMKLDSVEAQLETLVLEQQALLRRSMTISTEKQNEIEYLKRQAAKRMSQVYELTDLLTKALTEKSELDSKLQSATADQTQMRDTISSQTSKISQLESSNSPLLTNGNVNSQAIGTSCVKVNGTKMFLETDAVANSKKLGTTFDELQAQIKCLSTGLIASKDVNIKLTCQIGATNSRYNTLAMKHKECLDELEKVSNEKANAEATYKNRIHELEESINEQNEEMKALHVAVATSQAQTVDLTAQVTTLTSEREECNAKLEEAAKEMSQLQSTIVILNTHGYTTEALFQDLRLDLKADVSKTRTPEKSLHGNSTALLANEMGELGDEAHHHNERSVSVASDSLDDEDEATNVQLFAFDATLEGNNWGRPKRKLKSIARFESMTFDPKKAAQCKIGEGFSCPRCSAVCSYDAKECEDCQLACYYEAGIGVVVLKERKVTSGLNSNHYWLTQDVRNQPPSKSILCHCQECNKRDMTMRGLTLHYAKEHGGKPQWQKTGYSCPFCPSPTTDSKSLSDIEAHVNLYHPDHRLQKPNTSKKTPNKRQDFHGGAKSRETHGEIKETGTKKRPPSWAWTKVEHVQLLPGRGKEYPRELLRVIEFIEAQCKNQEEKTEKSRRDWADLFKDESEAARKANEEERLLYDRGIRNRLSLADQERLEKIRYEERADELRIRYEYANPNPNMEDIEIAKLCSRRIVFSDNEDTHFDVKAGVCLNHGCQLCNFDGVHRQQLPENETNECNLTDTTSRSPSIQTTVPILNPAIHVIDVVSFAKAEAAEEEEVDICDKEVESTKRKILEEFKLEKLQNSRHSLEFIKNYNYGYVSNAWAGVRKDKRTRK